MCRECFRHLQIKIGKQLLGVTGHMGFKGRRNNSFSDIRKCVSHESCMIEAGLIYRLENMENNLKNLFLKFTLPF
jgi:hypothetical protein